jgi:BlaI family penicillinase repressor
MCKDLAPKISDSELEIMRVLWRAGDALPVTEIRETLQKTRGWEATTVKTLISRLVTKGVLRQEKRQVYYYSPLITEAEYNDWATHDLISRVYHGSARDLVAALVRSDGLTQADIDELRDLFRLEES